MCELTTVFHCIYKPGSLCRCQYTMHLVEGCAESKNMWTCAASRNTRGDQGCHLKYAACSDMGNVQCTVLLGADLGKHQFAWLGA